MNKRIKKETEACCDYVLPDYMGDIRKILCTRAECIPGGKFVSDGTLELTGMVEYEILYADSENKLTAIKTAADYSVSVPTSSENYVDCCSVSKVSGLNVRIGGPRKVSLKAAVEAAVTLTERAALDIGGDVFASEKEPEESTRVINIENYVYSKTLEREYADEAERIAGAAGEEIEILSSGGSVRIFEVRATEGGVEVKGEVVIVAIVRTEEQPPFAIRKAIPFTENIEIDGATPDSQVIADGYVTSATLGVSEDGEDAVIAVNAIAEFEAHMAHNEQLTVVTDAYLKDAETDSEYKSFDYMNFVCSKICEIPVNARVPRESVGCSDARGVIVAYASLKENTCNVSDGSAEFSGEIAISGVACEINVDGTPNYIPVKFSVPYSQNVNFNCQIPENSTMEYSLTPALCEVLFDGDEISVRCFLKLRAKVALANSIKRLCECSVSDRPVEAPAPSCITVYYPKNDETLFSIAKRFHTTMQKIAADNSLSESVFLADSSQTLGKDVKKLIIR